MTGGSPGDATSPESSSRAATARIPLSPRQIVYGAITLVVLIVALALFIHYRAGQARRTYDKQMLDTLDHLLTAQEGFFYDSSHYVGSLRALPTVRVAPGVHVELVSPDRHSWWGVTTHAGLSAHRCVVWVGTPPASFPAEARAPENEAKPMCFDDVQSSGTSRNRS